MLTIISRILFGHKILLVILFLGIVSIFTVLARNVDSESPSELLNIDINLRPAYTVVASGEIDIEGGISNISANLDGIITEVLVNEGDWVSAGQILAIQESQAEQINLKRTLAALDSRKATHELLMIKIKAAEREVERLAPLYEIGAVTRKEFDLANDAVAQLAIEKKINDADRIAAEGEIEQANFALEQRTIRAPLAGQIVSANARPGVGASTLNVSTLFTLIPDAPKVVRAFVDDSSLADIYLGQLAQVYAKADQSRFFNAEVIRIGAYFPQNDTQQTGNGGEERAQLLSVVLSLDPLNRSEADLNSLLLDPSKTDSSTLLIGQKVQVRFLGRDAPKYPVEELGDNTQMLAPSSKDPS